jgi:hypothetical protein
MAEKKARKAEKKRAREIELKTQPNFWSKLGKGRKALAAVATAIIAILTAYVFLRPSISLELEQKDPANIFDSLIKVTNTGNFTLYDVEAVHWVQKMKFASGGVIENVSAGGLKFTDLGNLEPGESSTSSLGEAFSFSSPPNIVESHYCTNIHFTYFFNKLHKEVRLCD